MSEVQMLSYAPWRHRDNLPAAVWEEMQALRAACQAAEAARLEALQPPPPVPPDGPPRAICYLRVSDEKWDTFKDDRQLQAERDQSIALQWERCTLYYKYKQLDKDGIVLWPEKLVDPGVSARTVPFLERPSGARLHFLARPGDHVIFAHVDRGFRALRDFCNLLSVWETHNVYVHFADLGVDVRTASGRLVASLMAVVAQGQSDMLSERSYAIARRQKESNRPASGTRKLGYLLVGPPGDRQWAPFWEERRIMAQIAELREKSGWPWQRIADQVAGLLREPLNIWAKRTRGTRRWDHFQVRRLYLAWVDILKREGEKAFRIPPGGAMPKPIANGNGSAARPTGDINGMTEAEEKALLVNAIKANLKTTRK